MMSLHDRDRVRTHYGSCRYLADRLSRPNLNVISYLVYRK